MAVDSLVFGLPVVVVSILLFVRRERVANAFASQQTFGQAFRSNTAFWKTAVTVLAAFIFLFGVFAIVLGFVRWAAGSGA
jgi:uncharacterized membrane protein